MDDNSNNSKFICLTCGRSLDRATSICTCGGRATRRPRPEQEIIEEINEINQKTEINFKYRKIGPIIGIAMFAMILLGRLLDNYWGIALMGLGFLILIGYSLAGLLYFNYCPFCGRLLNRVYLSDEYCPRCGKRIKPIEKHKYTPPKDF